MDVRARLRRMIKNEQTILDLQHNGIRDDGCWFPRGTEPVFPPRSEPPLSMVF